MTDLNRYALAAALCLVVIAFGPSAELRAQTLSLAPQEQAELAAQFAPVLLFHPEEKYFPTNPLFPVESQIAEGNAAALISRLGTPESRSADYQALTLEEKARIATVYYRAYPARNAGKPVVVLEYWFYYVRNEYRVRSNVLPVWMSGSHPNDLEHIHLVLQAQAGKYSVEEAYASAHEGKIPANRYRYGEPHQGSTRFLVERGSHAMAPDTDADGMFTFRTDGDSGSKVLWGIRDRGYTWPRYRKSYMDPRSGSNVVIFSHEKAGSRLSYRLVPVDSLTDSFAKLNLTGKQRKQAFENQTFWFTRLFGRDNGRSAELLVPHRVESGGKSVGVHGVSSSERLFLVGAALNVDEPGLFVGARYAYLTPSIYFPDLMFEIDGIVTKHNQYVTPQFLLSYPLDGFTRIMVGKALVTDSLKFSRRQWDTVGTIEVRLGDMRISATTRSTGPVHSAAKEFRLFYSFP